MSTTKTEVLADVSTQVHGVLRELRTKIGSQRAVELIEEVSAKTVAQETKPLAARMAYVEGNVMLREDLVMALAGKADTMHVLTRASKDDVTQLVELMNAKVGDVVHRCGAVERAAQEGIATLDRTKLDKKDTEYEAIVQLMRTGGGAGGGLLAGGGAPSMSVNGIDRCLSCNRPTADPPATKPSSQTTPASGRVASAGSIRGTAPTLEAADAMLSRQLDVLAATAGCDSTMPSAPESVRSASRKAANGGGAVTDWVHQLDVRFKDGSKPMASAASAALRAPHPPKVVVTGGAAP